MTDSRSRLAATLSSRRPIERRTGAVRVAAVCARAAGLAVFALCMSAVDCRAQAEGPPASAANAVGPQSSLFETLSALTPEGWKLYDDTVLTFTAESLYEKINGRAEFYLAYDVINMTFASYEKGEAAEQFIDVSVYDMGTPIHAFGVFAGERTFEAPPLELGRDSYRSGANYFIWKGQYYVQIIASDTTADLQLLGFDIGREVTSVLDDGNEAVWGLDALPQQDKVPGSEQFFLVDAMALDFMRNTFTARYVKSGTEVTVLLSRRAESATAQTALRAFTEYAGMYGEGVEGITVDGVQLVACDMGGEHDVIFVKQSLLGGVTGVEDRDLAIQTAVQLYHQIEVPR